MTEIWEKYPEVYHYTSLEGLQGTLNSQTLFATRYDHLNDRSEFRLLRDALPKLIEPVVKEVLRERFRQSSAAKRDIRRRGGIPKISKELATDFATIHFDAAFAPVSDRPATTIPYITSFCGHPDVDSYEREHGLLSQWRAYGGGGGFALVFDTKRLWQLCLKEGKAYSYGMIMFDDVVYQGDDEIFSRELGSSVDLISSDVSEYLQNGKIQMSDDNKRVAKILSSFARLKHRGFREEREVRIVACPITPERHAAMAAELEEYRNRPAKYPRDTNAVRPQIELFDFKNAGRLPISRVIVGPQQDQDSAVKLVKRLGAGTRVKVTASATPLIQQHSKCAKET